MDIDPFPFIIIAFFNWGLAWGFVLLMFLLFCSGLISGSEVAFFSLDKNQLKQIEEEDTNSANRILNLRDKPRRLLATILIMNNLINIGIVILSYYLLHRVLPQETMLTWGNEISYWPATSWLNAYQWASVLSFILSVVGITFLLILFGELLPKIYANLNNKELARFMSGPINALMIILAPLNKLMVKWGYRLEKKLGHDTALGANKDDIDKAIDLAVAKDKDSAIEAGILKSIVTFNDVAVKQIMRSRMDIVALDTAMTIDEMMEVVKEAGYSRLPVFEEELDNIKGILFVKDLIGYTDIEHDPNAWPELIRPQVLYVPEARKINDLLKDFQREHLHMAIVVDEYGGTSGIITMEDVIEEVIGDIKDEFDEDQELEYRRLSDHEFIFEGRTMLIDVCRVMDIDKSSFDAVNGDADSLAGFILDINGRMPVIGQKILFPPFSFTILSVSPKRIERIKVQKDT
ncbi:MAG TPA: gliding motility-associated protein GldE [Saprospiraceae bacterium]|nr:gliding motility-associated protein GldE [Saprospiraceae bacterium]